MGDSEPPRVDEALQHLRGGRQVVDPRLGAAVRLPRWRELSPGDSFLAADPVETEGWTGVYLVLAAAQDDRGMVTLTVLLGGELAEWRGYCDDEYFSDPAVRWQARPRYSGPRGAAG